MAAHKGNKYAEKWTEETVISKIEEIHRYNVKNEENYHLGLAIIENDLYPQWWSEMAEKFKDNKKVSETIKKCEGYLESRIINSTMSGKAKGQAMAIFYLKNKHGYKDEHHNTGEGVKINLINGESLTDDDE